MDQEELFRRLGVSLAIGLLVGLERGWQTREESDHQRTAGLRTFALTGLLGGICGLISLVSSPFVLAAGLLAFTGALVTFSFLEAAAEKNFSVTGIVAGILTFVLGAYATLGNETVAVAAAVAMTILLALREPLHSWVRNVTWPEMRSVLVLLAMSFLLLPILPNRPVDPWQVLNPSEIWLLAILIAAVSFVGYIAVRVLGERKGIAVAAIAGSLASSTATTLSFARLAREHPQGTRLLASGILLAGITMMARIVVLAGVLKPELTAALIWPSVAAAAVLGAGAAVLWLRQRQDGATEHPQLQIKNPFDLGTVLQLAGTHRGHSLAGQAGGYASRQRGAVLVGRHFRHRRCRCSHPLDGAPVGCTGVCCGRSHSYPGRSLGQHRIKGHDCRFRGRDAPRQHRRRRKRDGYWRPRHHVRDASVNAPLAQRLTTVARSRP